MIIFSKLPPDIIKYILIFDKRFIIRYGEIVSIIPKDDYRYNLLHYITLTDFNKKLNITNSQNINRYYQYNLPNLYDLSERRDQLIDDDSIDVRINYDENENQNKNIIYNISIGRLRLKDNTIPKRRIYYKGNLDEYEWYYIHYKYVR
jgi:hypothetical protein